MKDLAYPLSLDTQVFDELTVDQDVVANSVRMLVETSVGEIEGMPDYGTAIWSFIFDHRLAEKKARIHAAIDGPIRRYVPQAEISQLRVDPDAENGDTFVVDILFKTAGKPGIFEVGIKQ